MFQAYFRGWRRLAAGLVLAPGLSGLGADALGLLGRAAGQDYPPGREPGPVPARRAPREPGEVPDYGTGRDRGDPADTPRPGRPARPAPAYDERDDMPASARPPARPQPRPIDPKVLLGWAKQALDNGDLDKAQDLAMQAQAYAAGIRWGLFDDTPQSILKDVQKARARRDRDYADRLLAEARSLMGRRSANPGERAANLAAAEDKARMAAQLHGEYDLWDFGDRPHDVIAAVRKARDVEGFGGPPPMPRPTPGGRPEPDEIVDGPRQMPARRPTAGPEDRVPPPDAPRADGGRKKAAVLLMQEAKALEIGRHYVEARAKYAEAARLNAPFAPDEASPEGELQRLNVAARRKIRSLVDEARSCLDRKDETAAAALLDDAHALATGMGLDASAIQEARAALKRPGAPARADRTPPASDDPPPLPKSIKSVDEDLPPVKPIPATRGADVIRPIPPGPPVKVGKRPEADAPPSLPTIPDVVAEADAAKPPSVGGSPAKAPTKDPVVEAPKKGDPAKEARGRQMLAAARAELEKGETEAARKLAVELISGRYACKDEAAALLSSVDAAESERKIDTARRAFENGMSAYYAHNFGQALAIFQEIDGTLLPVEARKRLTEMMAQADVMKKQQEAAVAAAKKAAAPPAVSAGATRAGAEERVPVTPRPAAGIVDLPPIIPPAAVTPAVPVGKAGSDSLLKQQEALTQVEFQKLRSKGLKVESDATARFGRGETDAALQDLDNFLAEVKGSSLEPAKQAMLTRPVEARMDRLKILKHQTDFLTKEARDRRNFKSEMTQEALAKQAKQEEVAQLMKSAHKLLDEGKHKEAYVQLQKAQMLDPDDASVGASLGMARTLMRKVEFRDNKAAQEQYIYEQGGPELYDFPHVNSKDPLEIVKDKEYQQRVMKRGPGGIGVLRSRSEAEKSIERKLSTPVTIKFKGQPLESVVSDLHTMTTINFHLDRRGLKEGNIDPNMPVTAELNNVSLKSALELICHEAGLKHVIESEAIRITTPKYAAGRQMVKSLSVGDLVVPAPNYGAEPGLSLKDSLRMATEHAYGINRGLSGSALRTPTRGLTGGSPTGTGSTMPDLPGTPGRMRNTPMEGGASSNTGPSQGTLERELIHLITTTIKPDSWQQMGGEGTIEYFPLGLALVINQNPEVIEEVERLLESLRRLQDLEVSIEVKVVSLAETFYERIGVDFAMGIPTNAKPTGGLQGAGIGQSVTGVSPRDISGNVVGLQLPRVPTPDLNIPIRATSFAHAIPPFGGFGNSFEDGGVALGLAFLSDIQVSMFLEAAQGDTRTNVMQAPKLTALNGTSASMTVGDFQFFVVGITPVQVGGQLVFVPQNVPFGVGISQPIPPNLSIQNGLINFTPTQPQTPGLGLFIQPVVSADRRFVRLNIQQSFTSLISGSVQTPLTTIITPVFENGGQGQPIPFTQYLQQPRFSNLETQTVVVVPDGGTVVMGGLKYMTEGRNEFGPPVLSKIPYLNRLFKNVAYGREGRSILIMVTPRVIINREEQERQTGVREDDFVGLVGP